MAQYTSPPLNSAAIDHTVPAEIAVLAASEVAVLIHCPDAVLEDVAEHGFAPLLTYFESVLAGARDQSLAFDALGCEITLCACGQVVWAKGAARWELMDGAPHRHPRADNDLPYEAMAAAWGHAPKPRPWQARYAGELA